jgi:2-dehydropantoate 2-reductase
MGTLFGGYLSQGHEVLLVDTDKAKVDRINREGIRILEPDGSVTTAKARAALPAEASGAMEMVLLFVKTMDSRSALESNRKLIGPDTCVMSLQNGAGHETVLMDFAPAKNIVLGTTRHNSSILEPGVVHHGGGGMTFIGVPAGSASRLKPIAEAFNACGLETQITEDIQKEIWEKLFVNASASALTAVLQTRLGFLIDSPHAWSLVLRLIREAVAAANADGMGFEEDAVAGDVRALIEKAREGYTSICADIRDGRKTEVDAISGAVVSAGERSGAPAPTHEFMVHLIHALEDRGRAMDPKPPGRIEP